MVNHKDFDVTNNNVNNLEWLTQKENVHYSIERMRKPKKCETTSATGHKYIYFRNGKYRLSYAGFDRTYSELEEAIQQREVLLRGKEYYAV